MQSLRAPFEIGLFWVPITGALALTVLAGGQIKSASAMPSSLSFGFFLCGAALVVGAVVGLVGPKRYKHWRRPAVAPAWRVASQYLFALAFGSLLVIWALMAAFRNVL